MKVYISSDHGGFEYKEEIEKALLEEGYDVEDCGNKVVDESDDYPDFVIPMAKKVVNDEGSFGVALGRSGNGEQIAANKVTGIRASLCLNERMVRFARGDNNANIIAIGADYINLETAISLVKLFVETPFSDKERHLRRVEKITNYETSKNN